MKNFKSVLKNVDVSAILAELKDHSYLWMGKGQGPRVSIEGGPFKDQEEILLRFNNIMLLDSADFDWRECVAWPAWNILNATRKTCISLMNTIEGTRMGRVMITKLPVGGIIDKHNDGTFYPAYFHRFHLTLQANGSIFYCGDEMHYETVGNCFAFDSSLDHKVTNDGDIDRITLIIDIAKPVMFLQPTDLELAPIIKKISSIESYLEQSNRKMAFEPKNITFFAFYNKKFEKDITMNREYAVNGFLEEIKPILPLHWEELGLNHDLKPLLPNYDQYLQLEKIGRLHIFTMRANGELIGYNLSFLHNHLHYSSTYTALNDIYYVKKEYRKGGLGLQFFKDWETVMKDLGVKQLIQSTKMHSDNSKMFEYLGYTHSDQVFVKMI